MKYDAQALPPCAYRFPISDNAIELDYVRVFELCHDGCFLKKFDLVLQFC